MLLGMMVIGLVAALAGAGIYAYFSDTETSTGNTFTAGTMNLLLNDIDGGITATWKSPDNWSPGKTVTGEIILTNGGSVKAGCLRFDFKGLTGDEEFAKKIYVTEWLFRKDDVWISGPGNWYISVFDTDGDGHLSLYELCTVAWANPLMWAYDYDDLKLIEDKDGNGCISTGDKVETPAGAPDGVGVIDHWDGIKMTFEFDPDAGNDYQGLSVSFDLEIEIFNRAATEVTYGGEGCGHGYQ